jgi:hypothetical protein
MASARVMDARLIDRIETTAERLASALFGAGIGYAAYGWLSAVLVQPRLGAYSVAAAAAAFLLCDRSLKRVSRRHSQFRLSVFDLREYDTLGSDELLLTDRLNDELLLTEPVNDELLLSDADRLAPPVAADELVLDDILGEIASDARVVRLFDRKAMPTPGELKARIDSHIGQAPAASAPVDASQALSDALAELKRSLR